jgi:signal transduction histidine kinase
LIVTQSGFQNVDIRVAGGAENAALAQSVMAALEALGVADGVHDPAAAALVLLGSDATGVATLAEETGRRVVAGLALAGGPKRPINYETVVGTQDDLTGLAEEIAATVAAGRDTDDHLIDWESLSAVEFRTLVGALLDALGAERVRPGAGVLSHLAIFNRPDPDGRGARELWAVLAPDHGADEDELVRLLDREGTAPLRDRLTARLGRAAHANLLPPDLPLCLYVVSRREAEEPRWLADARLTHPVHIRYLGRADLERRIQERPALLRRFFSPAAVVLKRQLRERTIAFEEAETRRREAQRMYEELKLEQRARARAERDAVWRELSWRIAHKIGNPTATIDLIEGNLRPYVTAPIGVECLDDLASCVTRINRLLHELSDYAAATGISRTPVPTARLHGMIADCAKLLTRRGGQASMPAPPPPGSVAVDEEKLKQVFDELFKNAEYWAQSIGQKAKVAVRYEALEAGDGHDRRLAIYIHDNGPGVRSDMKERIFTPYVTTRKGGSGHGLAIARMIIDNHHGEIDEIGEVGHGAVFRIVFTFDEELA